MFIAYRVRDGEVIMYCWNCGYEMMQEARYCSKCGASLNRVKFGDPLPNDSTRPYDWVDDNAELSSLIIDMSRGPKQNEATAPEHTIEKSIHVQPSYNVPAIIIGTILILIGLCLVYVAWQNLSYLDSYGGNLMSYLVGSGNVEQSKQNDYIEILGGALAILIGGILVLFSKN